jgi:hypothetical protein
MISVSKLFMGFVVAAGGLLSILEHDGAATTSQRGDVVTQAVGGSGGLGGSSGAGGTAGTAGASGTGGASGSAGRGTSG